MRKYALKQGFSFARIRTMDSQNQLTLALSKEDAEALYELRRSQGFSQSGLSVNNGHGFFYAVQPLPDLAPTRIKFGWANDPISRLSAYKTIAPEARILKSWPCYSSWEQAAIASITRVGCKQIGIEIFSCDSIDAMLERCNDFFSLMPSK
jgi:hypothetical protein